MLFHFHMSNSYHAIYAYDANLHTAHRTLRKQKHTHTHNLPQICLRTAYHDKTVHANAQITINSIDKKHSIIVFSHTIIISNI